MKMGVLLCFGRLPWPCKVFIVLLCFGLLPWPCKVFIVLLCFGLLPWPCKVFMVLMCVLVSCLGGAKCSWCLCVFWSLALTVQSVHSAYVCFGLLP